MSEEKIQIKYFKDDERAQIPTISYNQTSGGHDLFCIEDTVIPARGSAMVPNGLRVIIPEGYYLKFTDRSGNGIKKKLQIHQGLIDAGFSGPLQICVFNMSDEDQIIEKGKGICQVEVHKIPKYELSEATQEEWNEYCRNSIRGENGFGSSDKK